jgi:hypothetical protein
MPSTSTDRIDGLTTSVAVKAPCVVATTANITLSGLQTINGVAVVADDRVLVKDQTDTVDNGIYVVSTSAWSRAKDFDGARDAVQGTLVIISAANGTEIVYRLTTANPVSIGSSSLVFEESVFGGSDSAAVTFLQLGTGAVVRSVRDKLREFISVKDFGAACDDATDDTAAIQAAINSVGDTSVTSRSGPLILIPGPCRITGTLTIQRKAIRLVGNEWGNRSDAATGTRRSYLRWDGAAGIPMVKFIDCWGGAGVERLKLMGKTTAKPSAAIELNNTNTGTVNTLCVIRDVYIGGFSGETDVGTQFTDGIYFTGTNNNSEHVFEHIYITGCSGVGLRQSSIQNLNVKAQGLSFSACGTGVQVCGSIIGTCWTFANCGIDISSPTTDGNGSATNVLLHVTNYYSELAGRMMDIVTGRFVIDGGQFQITASLNIDGKVITNDGNVASDVVLRNFRFTQATASATPPFLSFRSSAAGASDRGLLFDGIAGWENLTGGINGLSVTTRGQTDRFHIYLRRIEQTPSSALPRISQNLLAGGFAQDFDVNRFDMPSVYGSGQIRLYDDFLGDVIADQWNCRLGTDPQCITATISAAVGGEVAMTTGDDVAGSMAVNGVQLDSNLNWRGTVGVEMVFEVRVKLNAITNVALFVGLTDQVAALEMPFTLAAGDALTSNATDAVGWLFDTGADTDNWWLVGVANDVDATKQNSAIAPVAGTYETLRVQVLYDGSAVFYRNGIKVGTTMTGALRSYPTAPTMTPVIAAFSRSTASRLVTADYVYLQQNRG